jgi:putative spermidine/putrescine transport system ATP-binding protein
MAPQDPAPPMSSYLVLDRLEKRFSGEGAAAVEALSLEVAQGELLGVLGPSGCGKTTTLRMIGGLTEISSGSVRVGGRDVTRLPPHLRDMGVVFQSYALFPHMTVARNLAFGLEMRRVPRTEIAGKVRRALEMVRLGGHGERYPRELSGGQQQRVALARALVVEPSILLLDEPLSNLDAHLRETVRTEIRDIQKALGITAVFVTHDQAEALAVCDRIAVMHAGRLEQAGTPHEIYEHPANAFVASFVGRVNRLDAVRDSVGEVRAGAVALTSAAGGQGPVVAMLRPHRIALSGVTGNSPGERSAPGRVKRVAFVGDVTLCDVEIGELTVHVERPTSSGQPVVRPGDAIRLSWREEDVLVFPHTDPS